MLHSCCCRAAFFHGCCCLAIRLCMLCMLLSACTNSATHTHTLTQWAVKKKKKKALRLSLLFVVWHIKVNLNALCKFSHPTFSLALLALPWFACMRIHTADTVATLSSCVCVCVPRKWLHLKGICLYKILLFAIYTRRVLFHLSFYTNTYTAHLRVLYVYMCMIYLCACRYTYTTFIHIYCMRLAFVNVAFLLHGIISHILIQAHTLTQRERDTVAQTIK